MEPAQSTRPRIGLVLGAGGLTGTAFHAGIIAGLASETGWDARSAEIIVGTSAGSTSAILLRAGLPPADFMARMLGGSLSAEGFRVLRGLGPMRPSIPSHKREMRPSSPALLAAVARRPWRFQPEHVATALVPAGTRDITANVSGVTNLFPTWPHAPTWICAVRLSDGQRVVFGRDAQAAVVEAVSASCAIPGYYAPVVIGGERYVDGGVVSMHNADLLTDSQLGLVVISAPLATDSRRPLEWGNATRVPIRIRLDREVAQLRSAGLPVVLIVPDAQMRGELGMSSMRLERRAPVAQAAQNYVHRLVESGALDALMGH